MIRGIDFEKDSVVLLLAAKVRGTASLISEEKKWRVPLVS
jgi:hypothetical protein